MNVTISGHRWFTWACAEGLPILFLLSAKKSIRFLFAKEGNVAESGEIEYGKGPKFDTAFADYWKYMASKSGNE
jgi:hypothetical protein